MDTVRLALAGPFLALAVCVVCMNWACVLINVRNRRHHDRRFRSMVPLVSLLLVWLAATAYRKLPASVLILSLLDPGNWLVFLAILLAPFEWLWKRFRV